tara:strand:- start:1450 stop:2310 length:861 start_codon:yes stop_codon:yes gene_type:complete
MLGYNRLGCNGRLGNQMFQYAALRGVAANRGVDFRIPPDDYDHTANYGLFETFNLTHVKDSNIGFIDGETIWEHGHSFNEDLFNNCKVDSNLDGFFQTEKYFLNIEDEIREDFTFLDEYLGPCKEVIDSIDGDPIFLHIRRTDAVGREEYHPILPLSYFEEALSNWDSETPCFVFTDDQEWCKSQSFFDNERFMFNENNGRYEYKSMDGTGLMKNTLLPQVDLCLMSLCTGGIIANSSFSWWGGWLQNNRGKIVAPDPKKWFGSRMGDLDTSDVVPDRWTIQEWSK